ncbi:MAG: DUF3108 domain-containing protein [Chloroflexi bacterium]|nr:DUF3108 domain-containing protein [Chloroflexota bacterium]
MRIVGRIAGLLVVVALLLGCRGAASGNGATLELGAAPWQAGDTANYVWLDQSGTEVGTAQVSFAEQEGAWVISQTDNIGTAQQVAEVRVDAETLEPLGEHKTIQAPNTEIEINTTYQDNEVDIQAIVNGEEQSASMDVPEGALDNDQLLMTLRALPFAEGYEAQVPVLVTQSALKVDLTVTVQGQEEIEVPAGTFNTWRVEISTNQGDQSVWYQVDAPHNLVQYDNGTTRMQLVES